MSRPELLTNDSGAQDVLSKKLHNTIIHGSSESMDELPDNSIQLVVTSPPYNVGKEYEEDLYHDDYLDFLKRVFSQVYRVLDSGGRACVNLCNFGLKPYVPTTHEFSVIMKELGFLMRAEIIWDKGFGAGNSIAWGSWLSASNPTIKNCHESILVFCKGAYGKKKAGRTDTITKDTFLKATRSVWNIYPVPGKRVGHPAPFPLELPRRLIELYSFKDDIVLDPFMGSGQTAIAALETGRRYIGYDTKEEYIALANRRIKNNQPQLFDAAE